MPDRDQEDPPVPRPDRAPDAFMAGEEGALAAPPPPPVDTERGLIGWLVAIGAIGLGGLLLRQQELAALIGAAGLFVAAQASDADRRWRWLYLALAWIVPLASAGALIALTQLLQPAPIAEPWKTILVGYTGWAAFVAVILWIRPVADALVQVMFREPSSHTLRLAARLAVCGLLIAIPAAVALRGEMMELLQSAESPLNAGAFLGSLVGYVALALAGVGFRIRRTLAQTWDRLGLRPLTPRDWLAAAITVALLVAVTGGADFVQKQWFHDLWLKDQEMTRAMAGRLGIPEALLLGISAGVGEEITMRGALQPKLGIVLTALLFASLHVQYTWFGILVILVLGVMLGLMRARTSTSVVMIAHTAFDVVAVFTAD